MLSGLTVLLAVSLLLSAGIGAVAIPPAAVLSILCGQLQLAVAHHTPLQETVLLAIRLPRLCLGLLVGGALAASGAGTQGLFRNPLADPGLVGISGGAALAAGLVIVLGDAWAPQLPAQLHAALLPTGAFLGGLATTALVYRLASRNGHTEVTTMLLAGVALNAAISAGLGFLIFLSNDQALRDFSFWMLGSLGGATWQTVMIAAPALLLPPLLMFTQAGPLNGLLLGETEAYHLGFAVERTKRIVTLLTALAVGAAVALAGIIGFVGLIVPHLARQLVGPDHRLLLPASLLLGGSLLLLADLLARTIALPSELPIGVLTSGIGAPFFLALLLRERARNG